MYGLNAEAAEHAAAAEPERDDAPPTPDFGADLSAGYTIGAVLGQWPDPGPNGAGLVSLGLYPVPAGQSGSRVGGQFWARVAAGPLPTRTEVCADTQVCTPAPFRFIHFGMDLSFRSDPAARWGGTFDMGFSDLVVEDYYGGPLGIPVFSVRPGIRHPVGPIFVEAGVRAGVGTQRSQEGPSEEWWSVSAELAVGLHVR